jgi:hypothetical protein
MKKLRKRAYEKSGKKYKDIGRFGEDEYMKQDKLPGMKKGGFLLTPQQKMQSKNAEKELRNIEQRKLQRDVEQIQMDRNPAQMKKGGLAGKAEEKYRKIAQDRLTERAKQINQKKADSFAKNLGGKGGPKITSKDKEALRFIKKVEARDATGKKSFIDDMAKGIKKREESPVNVERGMGKGYKKGGLAGKQKKLDANKDGKISGEDFKILRGKANKMKGGGIAIKGTNFKGVF